MTTIESASAGPVAKDTFRSTFRPSPGIVSSNVSTCGAYE